MTFQTRLFLQLLAMVLALVTIIGATDSQAAGETSRALIALYRVKWPAPQFTISVNVVE